MPLSPKVLAYLKALREQEWPEGVYARTMVEPPLNSWPGMRGYGDPIPFPKARRFEDEHFERVLRGKNGREIMKYGSEGRFYHKPMNARFDKARNKVEAEGLLTEYLKEIDY